MSTKSPVYRLRGNDKKAMSALTRTAARSHRLAAKKSLIEKRPVKIAEIAGEYNI
jgi:hypothetical protein